MSLARASAWLLVLFLPGTLPVFPPSCLALGPLPSHLFGMWFFARWHLCWCRPAVFMCGCWFLRGFPGLVLRSSCRRPLGRAVCALRRTMARRSPASFLHVGLAATGVPALTEVPPALLEWIVDFLRSAGGLPGDLVERAAASYSRSLAPSTLG